MAGFLYFIPNSREEPAPPAMKEMGLGHLTGETLSRREVTGAGPDGNRGLIMAIDGTVEKMGYFKEEQEWREVRSKKLEVRSQKSESEGEGGECRWWLGWNKEAGLPGAGDLEKEEISPGHEVKMDNEDIYIVPTATYLPRRLRLENNGEVTKILKPEFEHLQEMTDRCWWDYIRDCGVEKAEDDKQRQAWKKEHLTEGEQIELAVAYLAINYRVGVAEVNELGIFSDRTLMRTLEAIMDVPALMEMAKAEKKKEEIID